MPLKVSDGIGAWIKDFKKSDAPQFKGKSEKERRDQAIAAYLSAKRGSKNEDAFTKKAVETGKVKTGASRGRMAAMQKQDDNRPTLRKNKKNEGVNSADRKPQTYRDPNTGKMKVRMVPTDRAIIKDKDKEEVKEGKMKFEVDIEGMPKVYMDGNSPSQVKAHLRKLVKQPSMIKSVSRVTKHDVKKAYRDKAQGKDEVKEENRRDRLRGKLAAVGKDMEKTNKDIKKTVGIKDEPKKPFKGKYFS